MTEDDVRYAAYLERMIFSDPWSEKVYRETLGIEGVVYLVAEDDEAQSEIDAESKNRIVGVAGVRNIVGDGEITNVMISPDYRKRGLAYQLLEQLLKEGEQIGIRDFTLEVRASNDAAIGLYEKLGFVGEGLRKNFYNHPAEDALIMWKRNTNVG